MSELTLALIKPAAVKNFDDEKIEKILRAKFNVLATKYVTLTKKQAEVFYKEHEGKPFFDGLTDYMASGTMLALVLEGTNAIENYRKIMGATDPKKADPNSLRGRFGTEMPANAVHGSDSTKAAEREISFFFATQELLR